MTTTTSNKTTTIEKENKTTKNKRIQVTKPFEMMMNALALSRDLWIRKKSPEKKTNASKKHGYYEKSFR